MAVTGGFEYPKKNSRNGNKVKSLSKKNVNHFVLDKLTQHVMVFICLKKNALIQSIQEEINVSVTC